MKRRQPVPCERHHQQPPVPEGDDEGATLASEPARPITAFNAPAIGQIYEADIAVSDPAGDPPQRGAAQKTSPGPRLGQFHRQAVTALEAASASSRSSTNCIACSRA